MTSLTAPGPVQEHVLQLRAAGASWQTIGSAAGVGAMTVFDLLHRSRRVSQATADALLSVGPGDLRLARVDANGAMLRLRGLQAMGHGSARVARAIGCHQQSIQHVVNGDAQTISTRLNQAIATIFGAWWDKQPPERTRNERAAATAARMRAERADWCQAAALDEELLDTPGYRPRAGYRPAIGTGRAPDICLRQIKETRREGSIKKMSQPAEASRTEVTPQPDLSGVRSAECSCQAPPGTPCTENGDHLERYLRAAERGVIDRQTLKEAVSGLDIIAPQAVVLSPDKAAEIEGVKAADQVVRAQLDAGFSADRIDASAEQVLAGRFEQPTATSEAFYRGYDETAATYAREARELEAGA